MNDLYNLYQEIILDHNQAPHHRHVMDDASCSAEGFNPLCGDKITLYLKVQDQKITDASFVGAGCAISTASASLLTDEIIGKNINEVEQLFRAVHTFLVESNENSEGLGKLQVLAGVKAYPARVKCATLAWHTLNAALHNQTQPVSTE